VSSQLVLLANPAQPTPHTGFICQLLEFEQSGCDATHWPGWGFERWLDHPLTQQAEEMHSACLGLTGGSGAAG